MEGAVGIGTHRLQSNKLDCTFKFLTVSSANSCNHSGDRVNFLRATGRPWLQGWYRACVAARAPLIRCRAPLAPPQAPVSHPSKASFALHVVAVLAHASSCLALLFSALQTVSTYPYPGLQWNHGSPDSPAHLMPYLFAGPQVGQ